MSNQSSTVRPSSVIMHGEHRVSPSVDSRKASHR